MKRLIPYNHPFKIAWDVLILCVILLFVFVISYRTTFNAFAGDAFYYALNLVLLADVALNFSTTAKAGHRRYESPALVARHYLRSWFAVDLVAALPFELILAAAFHGRPSEPAAARVYLALQCLTLVKILKAGRLFDELDEALHIIPAMRRLISVGYWLSMAVHVMALGWILIGGGERSGAPLDRYLRAIYWVTTTIATIGYGDYTPDHASNLQVLYTIVVEVFGVGMFSYIIANVSSLMSNLDVARSAYQRKLDEVNAYMRTRRVPQELQDRVRDYYSYLWATQRGLRSGDVMDDIPKSLSQEILLFLNRDLVNRVELFQGADELFIREAVQLLRPQVFLPDEYIIRQGEYGDCMYFLTGGQVRVLAGGREVATLGPGSPFGETALLEDQHRNASVVSTTYSTGYRLGKADFDALRAKYAEFDAQVREVAGRRKRSG